MEKPRLTQDQIGDLQEVGNIGAGNAAARLSELLHTDCLISIPKVEYFRTADIKKFLEAEKSLIVAIQIRIMGDIPAVMFIVMRKPLAQALVTQMTEKTFDTVIPPKDVDFTAQIVLKNLGDIMTQAFADSVNQLLKAKARYTMPEMIVDTWSTALDTIMKAVDHPNGEQLIIQSTFYDKAKTFEGRFFFILNEESQNIVLNRIKLLLRQ